MFLLVSFFLCLFDAGMSVEAKKKKELNYHSCIYLQNLQYH